MAAASAVLALSISGCSTPHDLSLDETCKQWKQLQNGEWSAAREDLRAAAPRIHEAVSKQVMNYVDSMPADAMAGELSDEAIDAFYESGKRLDDICGHSF